MKRADFAAKNTLQKIEYLSTNNKSIFDLLKVDITTLSDEKLIYLYDFSETFYTISDQAKELPVKLDAAAKTATAQFEDALKKTDLPENVKSTSLHIFKTLIVPAVGFCSKHIQEGYKKANARVVDKIATVGVIEILEKIIEFRKQIDSQFPGMSDTIISAASSGLVTIIGLYWPTVGQTLKTLKLAENVQSFLKVDNLETVIKTLNSKLEEVTQDKLLAEVHKIGEKTAELATLSNVPAEAIQKIGFNLETLEKTITQANAQDNVKEFVKYLGTVMDKMPAANTELSKRLNDLEASIIKIAANNLNAADMKKFEVTLKEKMLEVEETYGESFEKGKNVFEKIVYAQTCNNILNSTIIEFKSKMPLTSQTRISTEAFVKEAKTLIQQVLPNLGLDVTKQAKKAPLFARELGLDLKMELKINNFAQQGATR